MESLSNLIKNDLAELRGFLEKAKEKIVAEEHTIVAAAHGVVNRIEARISQLIEHAPQPVATPAPVVPQA